MPKVSVIMNCYNGEKYLREAIESVYAQTFNDWEIIFWDNASTDTTASIANSYDHHLRYFKSESLTTLGVARRSAVMQASGEWLAFLDCDDYWDPRKLEIQIEALEGRDFVFCYAGIREINSDNSVIREVIPRKFSGDILSKLLIQFDVNMVTPLIRRSALFLYDLNFDKNITASEEYNLFVRLAAKGPVLVLSEVLGTYRVLLGSLTNRQISEWSVERRYTLDQLKMENPGIETKYHYEFQEAYARGEYYRARYLISLGKIFESRVIMKSIANTRRYYQLLYFSLYVPGCWSLLHSKFFTKYTRNIFLKFL